MFTAGLPLHAILLDSLATHIVFGDPILRRQSRFNSHAKYTFHANGVVVSLYRSREQRSQHTTLQLVEGLVGVSLFWGDCEKLTILPFQLWTRSDKLTLSTMWPKVTLTLSQTRTCMEDSRTFSLKANRQYLLLARSTVRKGTARLLRAVLCRQVDM